MKFWQKKKTFDISETDQVYKVIYLGNVVTSWAKGEHTLEKPLTALWRNYCNNYANYHIKNENKKTKQAQNKQILMKLTICNQGLKAFTREFGLTEYWANRITFCGQNSNFPRVFAWIYRHEAKQKKQELRVHACFVSNQSNVNKMISTLQQKVNFALNEFKREKRLKENARRILSMNESLNLDEDEITQDNTDSELFNDFVDRLYVKINGQSDTNKLKDDLSSINSSEQMNFESAITSANTSKNSTLDSKKITRNPSQGSLNSIKSKSSTSSKKSINYDSNLMPVRRQFLVKGLKNFKEPIERSRSAPKLSSITEEFSSDDEEDEVHYFGKLLNNNFVNCEFGWNLCEEEPDDEEIIKELGLISSLSTQDHHDKTLIEFNENDELKLSPIFDKTYHNVTSNGLEDDHRDDLSPTIYENNENLTFDKSIKKHLDNLIDNHLGDLLDNNQLDPKLDNNSEGSIDNKSIKCDSSLTNCIQNNSSNEKAKFDDIQTKQSNKSNNKSNNDNSSNPESNDVESSSNDNQSNHVLNRSSINRKKETYLYSTCESPKFILTHKTLGHQCDLHVKQIQQNCKLIEDLVLNF